MTKAYANRPQAARLLERVLWPVERLFNRLFGSPRTGPRVRSGNTE